MKRYHTYSEERYGVSGAEHHPRPRRRQKLPVVVNPNRVVNFDGDSQDLNAYPWSDWKYRLKIMTQEQREQIIAHWLDGDLGRQQTTVFTLLFDYNLFRLRFGPTLASSIERNAHKFSRRQAQKLYERMTMGTASSQDPSAGHETDDSDAKSEASFDHFAVPIDGADSPHSPRDDFGSQSTSQLDARSESEATVASRTTTPSSPFSSPAVSPATPAESHSVLDTPILLAPSSPQIAPSLSASNLISTGIPQLPGSCSSDLALATLITPAVAAATPRVPEPAPLLLDAHGERQRLMSLRLAEYGNDFKKRKSNSLAAAQLFWQNSFRSNDDILELHSVIDLTDMLTLNRVEIPVRSVTCKHLRPFDLATHIRANDPRAVNEEGDAGKWNCPVCKHKASLDLLVVDSYFTRILTDLNNTEFTESVPKANGKFACKKGKEFCEIAVYKSCGWSIHGWKPSKSLGKSSSNSPPTLLGYHIRNSAGHEIPGVTVPPVLEDSMPAAEEVQSNLLPLPASSVSASSLSASLMSTLPPTSITTIASGINRRDTVTPTSGPLPSAPQSRIVDLTSDSQIEAKTVSGQTSTLPDSATTAAIMMSPASALAPLQSTSNVLADSSLQFAHSSTNPVSVSTIAELGDLMESEESHLDTAAEPPLSGSTLSSFDRGSIPSVSSVVQSSVVSCLSAPLHSLPSALIEGTTSIETANSSAVSSDSTQTQTTFTSNTIMSAALSIDSLTVSSLSTMTTAVPLDFSPFAPLSTPPPPIAPSISSLRALLSSSSYSSSRIPPKRSASSLLTPAPIDTVTEPTQSSSSSLTPAASLSPSSSSSKRASDTLLSEQPATKARRVVHHVKRSDSSTTEALAPFAVVEQLLAENKESEGSLAASVLPTESRLHERDVVADCGSLCVVLNSESK